MTISLHEKHRGNIVAQDPLPKRAMLELAVCLNHLCNEHKTENVQQTDDETYHTYQKRTKNVPKTYQKRTTRAGKLQKKVYKLQ
jgi:hypothetical protein